LLARFSDTCAQRDGEVMSCQLPTSQRRIQYFPQPLKTSKIEALSRPRSVKTFTKSVIDSVNQKWR
jgi:hypothetical protein